MDSVALAVHVTQRRGPRLRSAAVDLAQGNHLAALDAPDRHYRNAVDAPN
jgi:hypothetical protein